MSNDIEKKNCDEDQRAKTYRHHLQDIKAHFSNYSRALS